MTRSLFLLKRSCAVVLMLIGAFHAVSWLAHIVFRNSTVTAVPDVREVRSPDDEYRAVLQTRTGGGGLSPYCLEAILVVPAGLNLADVHDTRSYEVYSSNECDSFANDRPSPEIVWDDERTLKIRFSINRTAMTERAVRLRKRDASGTVSVKFAAEE